METTAARVERRMPDNLIELDRSGLEVLDQEECLRLLGSATLGRLGVSIGALPVIVPVTYRLVGDRIVFRTGLGTKLDAATRGSVVAFEVDQVDATSGAGWSVSVTGLASEVTAIDDLDASVRADIPRWSHPGGERFTMVSTDMVSGRRIPSAPPLAAVNG